MTLAPNHSFFLAGGIEYHTRSNVEEIEYIGFSLYVALGDESEVFSGIDPM